MEICRLRLTLHIGYKESAYFMALLSMLIAQKYRRDYWANHSFVRLFACTAHSFACLALLVRSAALIRSLAGSLTPELAEK